MKMRPRFLSVVLCTVTLAVTSASFSAPKAAAAEQSEPSFALKAGADNVGILVFDDLFITEFVGPLDTYKHTGDRMNVFSVGLTMDPIRTYEGVTFRPDFSLANAPRIDVLVVPSGNQSRSRDVGNVKLLDFIRTRAREAKYVTSHCWGAFPLAAAGLLDGRQATTFPTSIAELGVRFPSVKPVAGKRFVEAGNVITSNGGLAAFEAALFVVEKMYGKQVADGVAAGLVFGPENRRFSVDPTVTAQR